MNEVVFLDTSILLNVLDVPGKNSDRATVAETFRMRRERGATFVLPVVALIETGNHIAQLSGGHERREYAGKFVGILRSALAGDIPMAISGVAWDPDFLTDLVDGAGDRLSLDLYAQDSMGSGDASILHEMDRYRRKIPSATPVSLWTLDEQLAAHV